MRLQPLHDRGIVKRLKEEHTTSSGIVIPDTGRQENLPYLRRSDCGGQWQAVGGR